MKKLLSIALLVFMLFLIKTTSAQNYGLSFANSATYAQIPQDPSHNITGSITLEAWIYPTSWTTEVWRGSIINKEQNNSTGYMLRCGANGTLNFNIGTGSTWKEVNSPANTLMLNTWQHIAGVFNGTTLTLYVNGIQVGTPVSYTGTIGINTVPIEIGRSNIDINRFFNGRIDEVRIWNSAISATDLYAYYNSSITSSNPNYSTLVAYYEMDNYSTDTDNDGNLDITATVGIPGEVFTSSYGPACNSLFTSSAPSGTTTVNTSHPSTAPVSLGNTNAQIMKVAVDVFNDATISQLVFQTNGTTTASDIANARVWYTGGNGTFSTSSQFGATINTPPSANNNMIFSSSQILSCGRHYFWLTYDILPTATVSNLVDATLQSATIDGSAVMSLSPNPTGSREILSSCAHIVRMTASTGSLGWNGGQVDIYVNGNLAMTGVGSTFLTGAGPKDTILYASTLDTIAIIRTIDGSTVANMRISLLDGNGTVKIATTQPTTAGIGTRAYCGGIVTTNNATLITDITAQLNGLFANCFPTETGFRYKKPVESDWNYVQDIDNPLTYSLQGLLAQTQYHYQAYAIVGIDTIFGSVITFTTACGAITSLPWSDYFDTYGSGSSTYFPTCWLRNSAGTTTAPYISSTNFSSPGSLYFSASSTTINRVMGVSPLFDSSIPINTLKAEFKMRVSGTDDSLVVGVMSDPTDISTFTVVQTLGCPSTSTYIDKEVFFSNYTGTGQYIAFRVNYGASSAVVYLDNVSIMTIPACPRPTYPSVTNITNVSVDLAWTENGSATQWEVEYGPVGFTQGTGTIVSATSNPFPLYGLTQATAYTYYVKAICSPGNESVWSEAKNFATNCDPIVSLPYIEDFETTPIDSIPTCYNKIQSGYGNVKVRTASFGGKVLEMSYSTAATGDCYIILPQFSAMINTLRVGFKYDGGSDNHKFGYITDPTNPATFTEIFNVNIQSNTGGWYFYDMLTNNTLTGSERIAIKYNPSAGYHNNRYDSLTVDIMPSCLPPFGLNATSITTTDAILSWSPAGTNTPVDYNLDYRPVGSTTWTTVNNVTPPYSLGGLMASTFYEYRLQANCGGSVFTDWSNAATFMTACGSITTLPWADSFDAYGTGTTSFPPCWTKTQLGSNSFYISSTNASSPGSLYSYVGTSGNYNIAVTPQFDATIPVNTLKVDFKYRVSSNDDTLYVGVMTNPTDASTFELVAQRIPNTTLAFQDMEVYMNGYTGVGQYIAFKTAYTSSASTSYLDDVEISTIPACPTPSALSYSNVTAYSADFTWLENGTATSWVIEYGPIGFTQGTGTVVSNVTTNPYTLTGLTPNTAYQFYVQSNCSGSYSAYSNAVTLTTGLIPINLPYVNDFENSATYTDFGFLNGTQANKWTIGSATGVNNTVGGTNAMYISNDNGTTWAYTAGTVGNSKVYAYMDINVPIGANEVLLDFDWIAQGSSAQYDFLRVYMMPVNIPVTAGNIPPTVNSVNYDLTAMIGHYTGGPGDHWLSVQSTWQHKQFNINSTQFPNLAGNTWRLYFHWRNDQTNAVQPPATIDNISIVISTCPAPSALAVTNVSSSSVELGWTENGSATAWTVEYGLAGFTLGTGTQVIASANPFVVPGLNPATIYDFYVKANCGASDFSGWTNKVTATTSCVPVALPIIEGFESSLSIPTCWTTTYTLNNFNVTTTGTSPTCSPNGGSNMLRFNSFNTTAGNHAVLYSPLINVTGDSISVSYWQYRDPGYNGAQYATEGIEVFYNTTPSLTGATSLGFTSRSFATAGWYQISYIIPSGLIGNAFVIFKATSEYGNNQFIDDISIAYTTIVPCTVPTNLAVSSITTSTATATWTAGGTETQWEVAYKPTSASTWNSAFVTAPTYNFSTLTAATVYDVKVRAICEVGDTSAYTAVVNFTTVTPPCNVPINLQVPTATITDQSAIFTWTAGGTETQWQVEYKLVSSTNWTTMPISTTTTQLIQALQSSSTYEVRVKALCGTGDESPFTTPVQFTTLGSGTYTITASTIGSGTITPSGAVSVNLHADQTFIFTPGTGNIVTQLLVDNQPTIFSNDSYTFTNVTANHTIVAHFGVGIDENSASNFVSLYPNPTNSTIELKINQTQLQVRECQLYDIYGKLIKVISITEENTKIDVSEYASGVYFVRMNTEMGPISKKFVKK